MNENGHWITQTLRSTDPEITSITEYSQTEPGRNKMKMNRPKSLDQNPKR